MQRLLVLVLSLFLAGAVTAGSARSTGGSPLTLGSLSEVSGSVALGGNSHGQRVRFLPRRAFAVGVVLQNTSRSRVVVQAAAVVEPPRTLIHQIGTRFHRFSGAACANGGSCPATTFRIGSGIVVHPQPHPFTVAPGKFVGVELDFRLGSCAAVPGASSAPVSRMRVTFRTAGGSARQRVFGLGYDSLRLRMPKPEDCSFPRSTLWVNDSSHIGTSYYFTIPGSKGDVCTRTGDGLAFRSRAYLNNDRRPERIEIRVPHFAGAGVYRRAIARVVVGARTMFHSEAVVSVAKATSREVFAHVHADRLRPQAATVPFRIYGWMRCRVHS